MSRISQMQVPPNGWAFQTNNIWFRDETANALIDKIAAFRSSNSLPPGEPWQEIQDQICARYPDTCLDNLPAPTAFNLTTAFQRFKNFATTLFAHVTSGGELVDQNTANIRATTCASCHNNVASADAKPGSCGSCRSTEDAAITALRRQILRERHTSHDIHLKTCGLCGCDLKLKVWFKREILGVNSENENAWPSFCWLKQI